MNTPKVKNNCVIKTKYMYIDKISRCCYDDDDNNIRKEAKGAGVPFWKIADYLKVSEPTFTRLMRRELSAEKKAEIRAIIKELREGK